MLNQPVFTLLPMIKLNNFELFWTFNSGFNLLICNISFSKSLLWSRAVSRISMLSQSTLWPIRNVRCFFLVTFETIREIKISQKKIKGQSHIYPKFFSLFFCYFWLIGSFFILKQTDHRMTLVFFYLKFFRDYHN